jgi:hypothetical protein
MRVGVDWASPETIDVARVILGGALWSEDSGFSAFGDEYVHSPLSIRTGVS